MRIYKRELHDKAGAVDQFREESFLKELLLDFMRKEGIAIPATEWDGARIKRSSHGKPFLQWDGHPVHFSISHSGPWWVCAVDTSPIGIDIEYPAKHRRYQGEAGAEKLLAIGDRFFSQEENIFLQNAGDPCVAFYEIWVRKEAYLKYLGLGLAYGLSQFSVVGHGDYLEELKDPQGEGVQQGSGAQQVLGARLKGLALDSELIGAVCRHPNATSPIPAATAPIPAAAKGVIKLEF